MHGGLEMKVPKTHSSPLGCCVTSARREVEVSVSGILALALPVISTGPEFRGSQMISKRYKEDHE